MSIAITPDRLRRYKDIAGLLVKYGRSDIVRDVPGAELPRDDDGRDGERTREAKQLADDLERLGPIFVKLGQVLSTRADLLPKPYVEALTRLQDSLEPFPFEEVEQIVQDELGIRISKAFLEFEREPLAVASLGQVHRAVLRDGRPVAVKVQRPGIRGQIAEDLDALQDIAKLVDQHTTAGGQYHFGEILDEFKRNLARELDYRQEARSLTLLGENLREFERILVPSPVDDYTTSRVLTMDYLRGTKVTEITPLRRAEMRAAPLPPEGGGYEGRLEGGLSSGQAEVKLSLGSGLGNGDEQVTSPFRGQGGIGSLLAEELFKAYLKQILVDGFFHADPHPGNILLTGDDRLALIDLGMIGQISPGLQEQLILMLLAVGEGQSDDVADICIRIGEPADHFDEQEYRRRVAIQVASHRHAAVEDIQIGSALMELTRASGDTGIRMPAELTMLSKTLLNLDEIGRSLDPTFDPNASIRRNAATITRRRMMQSLSPGNLFAATLETAELVREMPRRISRILDSVARNQLKVKVEAIDEATLIEGFQKVANRIAVGVVLAALIVGASLLMQVKTSFRLFGYPGLAMILFMAAAACGFWLVLTILINDRKGAT